MSIEIARGSAITTDEHAVGDSIRWIDGPAFAQTSPSATTNCAAIAERLAHDGYTVIVNYAGNAAAADETVAKIVAAGGKAVAVRVYVSDSKAVAAMFDTAETAFGRVDVLVNNAGIMSLASLATTDDAAFDRMVAINLKGTFNGLREAAKRLRNGGRIISFSTSVSGCGSKTMASMRRPRRWSRP